MKCATTFTLRLLTARLKGAKRNITLTTGLEGVGTQLPWIALLSPEERAELRAATTAPSLTSDVTVHSILGARVCSILRLTISVFVSPMVPIGAANFPVLTGGVVPANADDAGAADESAGTLTANVLDPVRLTGSYRMRREDLGKLAMMEDSLRLDLSGALLEARDKGVIAGTGTAPAVVGFLATANAVLDRPNQPDC